jgi:hypothetical protein
VHLKNKSNLRLLLSSVLLHDKDELINLGPTDYVCFDALTKNIAKLKSYYLIIKRLVHMFTIVLLSVNCRVIRGSWYCVL